MACCALIKHMGWANSITKYLLCMKHIENLFDEHPKINEPFTEMEIYTNFIAALLPKISLAYWATKG